MNKWIGICVAVLFLGRTALAEPAVPPPALEGVGIEQKLGTRLPLDLPFRDESGRTIRLGDCFHGRPVIFSLVYFQCPMLCTLTLNQLSRSLTAIHGSAGQDFDIVTVSFDPRDNPETAAAKKANYLRVYRRPTAEGGWHFLTGNAASIDQLTKAAGFSYRWDDKQQQFVHASAVMVLTPDGTLSRYFLGVDYPPTELQAALDEASRGTVGPPAEAVYFYCFRYDPATGKYSLMISRLLQALGAVALLCVVGLIGGLTWTSARRAQRLARE